MSRSDPPQLPSKPDDVLPDSTSPYGPCPRCGRLSNFSFAGQSPVTFTDGVLVPNSGGPVVNQHDEQVSILTCQGCRQNVVVIEEMYVGGIRKRDGGKSGLQQWRGIHWWPTPGMRPADPDIPAAVADAVAEGTRCLATRSPRAAVVMFRGALAEIVADRGSDTAKSKHSLFEQLKQMANDGDLDRTLADWTDHVRTIGNAGAHPSTLAAVSLVEADELGRLINAIIDYLYIHPARVRRARAGRP
jgi:hypothetical protein